MKYKTILLTETITPVEFNYTSYDYNECVKYILDANTKPSVQKKNLRRDDNVDHVINENVLLLHDTLKLLEQNYSPKGFFVNSDIADLIYIIKRNMMLEDIPHDDDDDIYEHEVDENMQIN